MYPTASLQQLLNMMDSCIKIPNPPSPVIPRWRLQSKELARNVLQRNERQAFHVCANADPQAKGASNDKIIMVHPLEAKRLAAKQMQEIRAKEKLKRQRWIEAINGTWAMIGLTIGLIVEGQTGKSILAQLAGYWAAIIGSICR